MADYRLYGNRTDKETELELSNRNIARCLAREGFVLLENDGVLPLENKKVALYGAGARLTIKGGSGSGDVRERYSVNIEEGLKNHGFEIVSNSWLSRFTENYEKDKKAFREMVEENIKNYPMWKVMDMFNKISSYKLDYPVGDLIKSEDINKTTDTAIYVIARQAGEGFDRKLEKGDYLLSDLEVKNLMILRENYQKLIVIINTGASIDINQLDEIKPNALVYYGQAGEEGGNALADVLCGEYNFSGHLTDSWVKNYSDTSVAKILHPELLEENYEEGIYVGYRYYDAAKIMPHYPFGYGLSYTTFRHQFLTISADKSTVTLKALVKNTGERSGKEVLLAFLYKPNKEYYGEVKSLCSFIKTGELNPDEEETVTMSFDLQDFAVYDEKQSAFVLEKGKYGVAIGTDALHTEMVGYLNVKETTVIEQCKPSCVKKQDFEDYRFETEPFDIFDLPVCEIELTYKEYSYNYSLPVVSDKVRKIAESLTDKELAMYGMGGGYFNPTYIKVLGACGNTTSLLTKKGIPSIIMSDGPAGINIMPKSAYNKNGTTRYIDELPEEWQWGWLKRVIPKLWFFYATDKDTKVYQYCTAYPNATMMAQTYNPALVEKAGKGIGEEMLTMGITLWLAPALNIHRDPLCGRNFEYYSEDPVVSGIMASAMTRGVQSNKGVGVTIKHFACNNRENQRMQMSSNLSERALREIYLKGFRIACRENPMAIMSSYNKINGTYAPNNRELLIDILRCEWGYEGLVMSDWDAVVQCSYTDAIKCGNNMIMPGTKVTYAALLKGLKDGSLTRNDLMYSALYALKMVYEAKTSEDFEKEHNLI